MHEFYLIKEIIDNVLVQAKQSGINEVTLIKLAVGKLSGALPRALEFGFEAVKQGTELEKACLEITETDPLFYCDSCKHKFKTEWWTFTCENCGSNSVNMIAGQELILEYFEGQAKGEERSG